jgi:hypothetical protein
VDPKVHAAEVARFRAKIVAVPGDGDCSIWIGSIGADGYGRYFITRAGMGFCVRPNRMRWRWPPDLLWVRMCSRCMNAITQCASR